MSSAILRRNSSKQGLQNLLRVTAQRSIEDAEEVEREHRRRVRESYRSTGSTSGAEGLPQDDGPLADDGLFDSSDLKPSSSLSLEEDEGFSDWTQRLERRRQQRMEELGQGTEEEDTAVNGAPTLSQKTLSAKATLSTSTRLQRQPKAEEEEEEEEEKKCAQKECERRRECEEGVLREERVQREKEEAVKQREEQMRLLKKREEDQIPDAEVKEKKKEVSKVSYTSKVFMHQEAKPSNTNGDASKEEVTSYTVKTKRTPRAGIQAEEEAEVILETEQRLEKIRRGHQEKESHELQQLKHRQVEAEQELEELNRRRGERRRVRDEEDHRREEEVQQRLANEEEGKKRMKGDMERRRLEAAERMKTLSTSVVDGDLAFSPLSPKSPTDKREDEEGLTEENTCLITERKESLNRSLKKSNSFKKTQAPVLLSKIDDKLEQYTHAIESSQEAKAAKQSLMDVSSPPEAVASKKNLFEAGEVWNQSPTKGTPSKDAEGLKVAVADLITQWVKGGPDGGSRNPPSRPADVKPGDVMQKKNMWEIIGDTSTGRLGQGGKGTPSGKRYKFIVAGHGKYEKIPVDGENDDEYATEKSDLCPGDY